MAYGMSPKAQLSKVMDARMGKGMVDGKPAMKMMKGKKKAKK